VALGRSNSLFAGLLRAGQRAAVIMSLIRSAKLNDQDPVTAKTLSTAYQIRIDRPLRAGLLVPGSPVQRFDRHLSH